MGNYERAQKLHTWVLMEKNKTLGAYHPYAQNIIIHIGDMLREQGDYEAAEHIYMQALRYMPEVRDTGDPIPRARLKFLASLYYSMNRLDELLGVVMEHRDLPSNVFGWLGRLLLRRMDDPNAQIAFRFQIAKDGFFTGLVCDGHSSPCRLSIATRRWVCRSCRDIDLCQGCSSKQKNGTLDLVNCLDH